VIVRGAELDETNEVAHDARQLRKLILADVQVPELRQALERRGKRRQGVVVQIEKAGEIDELTDRLRNS
jgi:hypothetical protein